MADDLMEITLEERARAALDAIKAELGPDDPINATKPGGQALARVVYLVPGEAIVWDFEGDCFGQLTARLDGLVPHRSGGRTAMLTPCSIDYWIATIEVVLLRCAYTVTNTGSAPTPAQLSTDGFLGASDMGAMLRAITKLDFVDDVVSWTPQGPNGGRFGTMWKFSTKLDSTPC